jgi:hypothetical protein
MGEFCRYAQKRDAPVEKPVRRKSNFCILRIGFAVLILLTSFRCSSATAQQGATYGRDFVKSLSGATLTTPAFSAGWSNYVSKPAGFGSGGAGYGYHYGVALGDNLNGKFMRKFVFAAASGHEENYSPLTRGPIWKRIKNAALHTLYVSPQAERKLFNWSGIPASFVSAALSDAYQPAEQQTWSATFTRAGTNSAGYLVGDIILEFTKKSGEESHLCLLLKCR